MYKKITLGLTAAYLWSPLAALANASQEACKGLKAVGGSEVQCGGQGGLFENSFKAVANTLIFVVGAVSVLMIIIGGLRYVLSGGDPSGVKSAKDTVLYAVVGVVVAILAFAIVNFVIGRIG